MLFDNFNISSPTLYTLNVTTGLAAARSTKSLNQTGYASGSTVQLTATPRWARTSRDGAVTPRGRPTRRPSPWTATRASPPPSRSITWDPDRLGRRERRDRAERRRHRQPRREPGLHHHARSVLPGGQRAGGRRLGGRGDELHVLERHRQPHHRGQLLGREPGHHRQRRNRRHDLAVGRGRGGVREQPGPSRSRPIPATASSAWWWTASRSARSRATPSNNVGASHTIAGDLRARDAHDRGHGRTRWHHHPVGEHPGRLQRQPGLPDRRQRVLQDRPSVPVDDVNVGAVGNYIFFNVTTNHTIRAVFAPGDRSTSPPRRPPTARSHRPASRR